MELAEVETETLSKSNVKGNSYAKLESIESKISYDARGRPDPFPDRPPTNPKTGEEMSTKFFAKWIDSKKLTEKQTQFKDAIISGDLAELKKLIPTFGPGELDFNLNTQRNMFNPSPLNAVVRPEDGCVAATLSKVTPVFVPGTTDEERFELVRLMLSDGRASPDWLINRIITRNTATFHACYGGRIADLKLLIEHGADPNIRAWDFHIDGITLGMAAAADGRVEILSYLQQQGLDLNAVDSRGRNTLHWLMLSGRSDACFEFLCEQGVDPFLLDDDLQSAFSLAIEFKPRLAVCCLKAKYEFKGVVHNKDAYIFQFEGVEIVNCEPLLTYIRPGQQTHACKHMPGRRPLGSPTSMVELAVHHQRAELLNTPVLRYLVEHRWETFGRTCYRLRLLFYLLFLTMSTLLTNLFPSQAQLSAGEITVAWTFTVLTPISYIPLALEKFLVINKRGVKSYYQRTGFFSDVTLLVMMITVVLWSILLLLRVIRLEELEKWYIAAGLYVFICWIRGLQFFLASNNVGTLVLTVQGMGKDAVRFMEMFGVIYLGFVQWYYVVLKSKQEEPDYWAALGVLYKSILGDNEESGSSVVEAILVLWVFLATFGLLNIVIAMFSNTYESIQSVAEEQWLLGFSEMNVDAELMVPRSWRQEFYQQVAAVTGKLIKEPEGKYKVPVTMEDKVEDIHAQASQIAALREQVAGLTEKMEQLLKQTSSSSSSS